MAYLEYTEKENAPPYGRISTHMPFKIEMLPVFRGNDLLALMLNHLVALRLAARRPWRGIAPPMTVSLSCGFRSFHYSFHDSQIISPCPDSPLVGEMGIVRDDFAVIDERGCRDDGIGKF